MVHGNPVVPMSFLEKTIFFFCRIVKVNWSYWCGSISGLYAALIYVCVPSQIPYCLAFCNFIVSLKIRYDYFDFFIFKIVLAILISLSFHINFSVTLSMLTKILLGFLLELH